MGSVRYSLGAILNFFRFRLLLASRACLFSDGGLFR